MGILDVRNMICEKCSHKGCWDELFCSKCGGTLKKHVPLPYTGENPNKGIYRITIDVECEFDHEDRAQECAEKSELGEEEGSFRDMKGVNGEKPVKWVFVRSTVTPKTHPYECKSCIDSGALPAPVSKIKEGRCEWCDQQDWVERSSEKND